MAKPSVYELWLQAGGDTPGEYDRDRYIDLMTGEYRIEDLPARIAAKITVDPVTGCWLWGGGQTGGARGGYGYVHWDGRMRVVHRVVYALLVGPIPEDKPQLDHVKARGCIHRHCCWPAHLEPVTHRENDLRGDSFAGRQARQTHCDNGHEFTPENTYWRPNKYGRDCLECRRDRDRSRNERRRLARQGRRAA